MIEKYIVDGHYENEEGVYYETDIEFMSGHFLGFCGCGNPEEALRYVRDGLSHIEFRNNLNQKYYKSSDKAFDDTWELIQKNEMEVFKTVGESMFFYYWCSDKKLTEHGSCVPGWLTDFGKEILEDLKKLNLDE